MDKNRSKPGRDSLWDELWTGMLVGMAACLVIAWAVNGGALAMLLAAPVGMGAGTVIGLLLWSGAATHADEQVLPPAPEQERTQRRRR